VGKTLIVHYIFFWAGASKWHPSLRDRYYSK